MESEEALQLSSHTSSCKPAAWVCLHHLKRIYVFIFSISCDKNSTDICLNAAQILFWHIDKIHFKLFGVGK